MIPALRQAFNESWREPRYLTMLDDLARRSGPMRFRLAESPCFFPAALVQEMTDAGTRLVLQLLDNPATMAAAKAVVPERFDGPNQDAQPTFIQVDFGLVRDASGVVTPRLVELQAFASLYGFQMAVSEAYHRAFALPDTLSPWLGGHTRASYLATIGAAILGGHDPREVVLMEIDPVNQKTWPDFAVTKELWGVDPVATCDIVREGRHLFYRRDGVRTRIRRIYNRVIPDELEQKGIALPFDYRDDLDVEWAGHPAWFFRISKFSIPFLKDPTVPRTWFLNELDRFPEPREDYLLKPLFSFAGGGIIFAPTDADLAAIPEHERRNYIVQERVAFAPLIDTPFGGTQAEVRLMYVWTDKLQAVLTLVRMGRGKMMGVDHNKGLQWVGASAGFVDNSA